MCCVAWLELGVVRHVFPPFLRALQTNSKHVCLSYGIGQDLWICEKEATRMPWSHASLPRIHNRTAREQARSVAQYSGRCLKSRRAENGTYY